MSWNSIVGQAHAKDILRSALAANRLAHAYLFSGADGTGKSAMAIELAKVLNCEKHLPDACDTCPSCTKFSSLQHPNLHLVFPLPVGKGEKHGDDPLAKLPDEDIALIQDELHQKGADPYHRIAVPKANNIKINSVREIRKESSLSMFDKGKRLFVILEADRMTDEAANALLKTLEEPHENTMLILTTSKPTALLPTIVSRCQHIRFSPVAEHEIADALNHAASIDRNDARLIAKLANGSYGRALELTETELHERYDEAVGFLRTVLYRPPPELLAEIDRIVFARERADIVNSLALLQSWLRETMLYHQGVLQKHDVLNVETIEKFLEHHPRIQYRGVFQKIDDAISLLGKNVYIPLILITLALELRSIIMDQANTQHSSLRIEA